MSVGKPVCNLCGKEKTTARTRMQYPFAFACSKCYRLWKRAQG